MPAWSFAPIPAPLVAAVRAQVPALVAEVVEAVSSESPVYAPVLGGPEGVGIRLGIEQAVVAFLDGAERGEHPARGAGELWRRLGESEFQAGRELELLRSAFRIGTRALWRGAAHVAAGAGVDSEMVVALAEAIFVYTDELASDVVEGYLRTQSDEAGELERRRRRVAALLLDPAGVDLDALGRAAGLARWSVPRNLAVLALAGQSAVGVTRHLDGDVLVGSDAEGIFLVLPDPEGPGRRALIDSAAGAEACTLGPTVAVRDAARSLRWARWLLELSQRGVIAAPAGGMLACEEHLLDLALLRDGELAAALVSARLGPLEGLGEAERERLEQTLAAWLAHQRHTPAVAEQLHVHPQTVRYRMRRLGELLGDALESPAGRLELELALRVRRGDRGLRHGSAEHSQI